MVKTIVPHIPQTNDILDAAQRAYDAGQMTWESVQEIQRRMMPYCEKHQQYTNAIEEDGTPRCMQCARERAAISHAVRTHQEVR